MDCKAVVEKWLASGKIVFSDSGCWIWHGSRTDQGYGMVFDARSKGYRAHRVFYTAERGGIPRGLVIDHMCGVRSCVNPDHLRAVTRSINGKENVRGRKPRVVDGICVFCNQQASEMFWKRKHTIQRYLVCRPCAAQGRKERKARAKAG